MGIFGHNIDESYMEPSTLGGSIQESFIEQEIYNEVSCLSDETRRAFLESDECKALEEAGFLKKRTIMRLSKLDDLTRRTSMMSIQLAKNANDPLYKKLVIVQMKRRQLLDAIDKKYSMKAGKAAKVAQKEWLKNRLPIAFMRK